MLDTRLDMFVNVAEPPSIPYRASIQCFFPNFRPTTRRHVVQIICCDVSSAMRPVKWENMTLMARKNALLSQKITLPRLTQVSKTEIKTLKKL